MVSGGPGPAALPGVLAGHLLAAGLSWRADGRPGPCPGCRSGGQDPGAVAEGQALADQVAQVQRGGAALEPGMVLGGAAVAELEPAAAEGGDLGDGAFHVGPPGGVVLAQPGGGPVAAGAAQQVVAGGREHTRS